MKEFVSVAFDRDRCRQQLETLRTILASGQPLEETRDLKPFFEASPDLMTFLGFFGPGCFAADRVAYQYQLFGDFACDIAVGDSLRHVYGFVELEDANGHGIFRRQGAKAVLEWTPRFERAFSQVVDWFWKLDDMAGTAEFETRFGRRGARYFGLVVNSLPVYRVTYDELCDDLTARLDGHYLPAAR
jgi:hypothetical protein